MWEMEITADEKAMMRIKIKFPLESGQYFSRFIGDRTIIFGGFKSDILSEKQLRFINDDPQIYNWASKREYA